MNKQRKLTGYWSRIPQEQPKEQAGSPPAPLTRSQRREAIKAAMAASAPQSQVMQLTDTLPSSDDAVLVPCLAQVPASPTPAPRFPRLRLSSLWPLWLTVIVLLPAGIGVSAFLLLFKLPAQANCGDIFWPTASVADRIHCGQIAASQQTVEKLLEAIDLVNELPLDHPARAQINLKIEEWSEKILTLAEQKFQEGKLSEAIQTAHKIPRNVPVFNLVDQQVKEWKSTWETAEGIYKKSEDFLRKEKWSDAFMQATRLLEVGNTYWATEKYQQINQVIQTAKADGNNLVEARKLADQGGLDNLVNAIKLAEKIGKKSHVYQAARQAISEFSGQMMDLAEATLESGNWSEAIRITTKIPESVNLQEEVKDFALIARAASQASSRDVAGLEKAISQLNNLQRNRPLYTKAQQYINRWRQEIADVQVFDRARQLAQAGGVGNLRAGIAELQTISYSNAKGKEARQQINNWTREVQILEDAPYLQRAEELASLGDINSLDAAISEARKIGSGRTLYQEAQTKIEQWGRRSQQLRDQPLLDQAELLASHGDLLSAVSLAEQIRPGSGVYDQARSRVRNWQGQLNANNSVLNAQQASIPGTPEALETAILLADQVPPDSARRWEAQDLINQWSQQIYEMAMAESSFNIEEAIRIARRVPPGTGAYQKAQAQIATWQTWLNPAPAPAPDLEHQQLNDLPSLEDASFFFYPTTRE